MFLSRCMQFTNSCSEFTDKAISSNRAEVYPIFLFRTYGESGVLVASVKVLMSGLLMI